MTKLHEAAAATERKIVTVRRKFYYKTKKSHRGLLYASFLPILLVPNLHKEESDPDLQQPQFKTKKQSRKPTKRPKTKQRKEKGTQDRHPNNKEVAKRKHWYKESTRSRKKELQFVAHFYLNSRCSSGSAKKKRKKEPPPETLIAQLQSLLSREASQSNNKHTSSNEIQKLWARQTTTTTTTTKNKTANQSKRLTPEAKDQRKNT
jgi:hypothetical protein